MARYLSEEQHQEIERLISEGLIMKSMHPDLPLTIYNYTTEAQFRRQWNPLTRMCRGLVVDDKHRIVIECVPKFFNLGEPFAAQIDLLSATISEKLDGYYIAATIDNEYGLVITSRGSFTSRFALAAKEFFTDMVLMKMVRGYTYFCELLQNFPGDEGIILTRHDTPMLICWAIKDTDFQELLPDEECPFPYAKRLSLAEAKQYLNNKVEGVVAQDPKTFERVKIKTDWFMEHHRILADCTQRRVWEVLSSGRRVESLDIPDEFMPRMLEWQAELLDNFETIAGIVALELDKRKDWEDRAIATDPTLSKQMKAFIFTLRKHGKDSLAKMIWKQLAPKNGIIQGIDNA